ncbi:tRNA (adenosine(37)-N6)-threonylcarbamoyltransferase complex dimerization subunit type 1 TsaB [Alkalibacterium kapii]|uniref:tRNA (Adenosine(37)-N6)-threonylcarbamoyltransferase complex dimerization subunit type 1 TsaB n=1 Tax=Alkalibacterium kapii TaxID=426704 RepID=A0A511ATY6_9LACT|nr:tRNA (adenosine(37)-N6)-threonylcarbamoyltransferase complex dimerization subunit type 1 TsaB [Alkalibacterium kapii]GEK90551.1 tRNA (adenosine(37)-N6)-threonylcarbamoyltransferase complex dimerization subunit type 1 TsaB [Alkalibacterium kapii]
MKLLAIDTSNQIMSVALTNDDGIVTERTVNIKRNHSIQLMPAISDMMKEAEWAPKDISRIVVAKGPGSYTGVRIGVTVAKTLAFSLDSELVGVSSLEVLAANGAQIDGSYCVPIFDARRGNIYTGLYQYQNGKLIQIENDTHISAEKWASYLKKLDGPVQLLGSDRSKHNEAFKGLSEKEIQLPLSRQYIRASVLAERGENREPVNKHLFEPEYLKLAEAEQNWIAEHPDLPQGGQWVEKL